MTKYNVYESIILSGCDPINTWVASFLNSHEAESYINSQNSKNAVHTSNFTRSYHIHSETN